MDRNYYDYYLRYISVAGMGRVEVSWSRTRKYLYYMKGIFAFACVLYSTIFGFADVILKEEFDVNEISSNLIDISISMNCMFRLVYMIFNNHKVMDIIDTLNAFKRSTLNGKEVVNMVSGAKIVRRVVICWIIFAIGCILFLDLLTLIGPIFSGEKKLFTPMYTFYDYEKFPNYELTLIYEITTQLINAYTYINIDIFFFITVVLINNQADILASDLRNLMHLPKLQKAINKETTINSNETASGTWRCGKSLDTTLAKCISHHQQLLVLIGKLQALLSLPSFLQCIFSTTYIMLGLFLIVISDENSGAMNGATYLYGSSIQLCFLSIFGQLLTNKFESLSEAIYEMPWYLENRKSFSTTIILLQMKFRQPVKISAGKFFDLSHATFATIVHSSFTYFTVLKEVTGNN